MLYMYRFYEYDWNTCMLWWSTIFFVIQTSFLHNECCIYGVGSEYCFTLKVREGWGGYSGGTGGVGGYCLLLWRYGRGGWLMPITLEVMRCTDFFVQVDNCLYIREQKLPIANCTILTFLNVNYFTFLVI